MRKPVPAKVKRVLREEARTWALVMGALCAYGGWKWLF